jgi:hypothetical protein
MDFVQVINDRQRDLLANARVKCVADLFSHVIKTHKDEYAVDDELPRLYCRLVLYKQHLLQHVNRNCGKVRIDFHALHRRGMLNAGGTYPYQWLALKVDLNMFQSRFNGGLSEEEAFDAAVEASSDLCSNHRFRIPRWQVMWTKSRTNCLVRLRMNCYAIQYEPQKEDHTVGLQLSIGFRGEIRRIR